MSKNSLIRIQINQELKYLDCEDYKIHSQSQILKISFLFFLNSLQNWLKILFKAIKTQDFLIILNLLVSFIIYVITLKGCSSNGVMDCVPEIVPLIPKGLLALIFSAFQVDWVVFLVFKRKITNRYLYLIFIEILAIFAISEGSTFQNHGLFNKMIFLIFLSINFASFMLFNLFYKFYSKKPRFSLFIAFFLTIFLIFNFQRISERSNCENWTKGLKETRMENNGKTCEISQPSFCFHDLTSDWFDLSRILNKNDCSKVKNTIPLYSSHENMLAFPKTQFFTNEEKFVENFQKHVLSLITPVQSFSSEYEVYLNQSDPLSPNLLINLQKNQSLLDRSHRVLNEKKMKKTNILAIFIDSVSRQHFSRKMPKTYQWIENFYGNSKSSQFESYQFFKYHISGTHTLPNMMRAFYGTDYNETSNAKSLEKIFKNQGFVTAKSSNLCSPTFFDTTGTDQKLKDFEIESFDHENIAFSCDPNYRKMDADGPYSYLVGSTAMVRRCLYGKDVHDYVLDYGEQFWRTYQEENKFLELSLMDGHEPSAELLKYLDEPLYGFLKRIEEDGLLEGTNIVFYADHGHHLNVFYYLFGLKDLMYELRLPMLFVLLPRDLNKDLGEYLKSMENVLISTYDVYNLFNFMAESEYRVEFGVDFKGKVEEERGYKDLNLEAHLSLCNI